MVDVGVICLVMLKLLKVYLFKLVILVGLVLWIGKFKCLGALINTNAHFPISELNALQIFYNSLNGDHWNWDDPSSLIGSPVKWDFDVPNPNPCTSGWFGITCNSGCTPNTIVTVNINCTVEGLALNKQNLTGTLPCAIQNLTNLVELSLSENSIDGPVTTGLGFLRNLTILDLSGNPLNTTIPDIFTNLQKLEVLDLSISWLGGILPPSLYKLANSLEYLDISGNHLTGTIN